MNCTVGFVECGVPALDAHSESLPSFASSAIESDIGYNGDLTLRNHIPD